MTPTLKIPSPPRLHRAAVAAEAARGGIGDALAVGGAGERGLVLEEAEESPWAGSSRV